MAKPVIELTPEVIFGFSETLLAPKYDQRVRTPDFHIELWEQCLSDERFVAIAAPRRHAKSTAVTHCFSLAAVLFRKHKHVLIISDTEKQASDFLTDIKTELLENDDLRAAFDLGVVLKDTETEFAMTFKGGGWFRFIAKGSGQKLRGLKWRNSRPDLVVGDDMENDELVENKDRRARFRAWFLSALIPAISSKGKVRVVGTILHFDSLLERLLHNDEWKGLRYEAHDDNFENILWPEQWPKKELKRLYKMMVGDGTPELYSQEMRNQPMDFSRAYFRRTDLKEFDPEKVVGELSYIIAADLAISKETRADYTVFAVCGIDSRGVIHVVDIVRERLDGLELIEMIFQLHLRYKPDLFMFEHGQLSKAILPVLQHEMLERNIYINLPDKPFVPSKDKETRAKPLQARARAGGILFNKKADYYPTLEDEMLKFPRGKHDDQVDALAWVCHALARAIRGRSPLEIERDEYDDEVEDSKRNGSFGGGRNRICGY